MIRSFAVLTSVVALSLVSVSTAAAQHGQGNLPNYLFSQYTTQGGASSATAGMYPAPHWVPPSVGSSYYTYQPLMPHEMMYTHSRNYYNYYNDSSYYGGGPSLNKTSVKWQSGCSSVAPFPLSGLYGQRLKYRLAYRAYGMGCAGGNCDAGAYAGDYGAESYGDAGCATCGD